MSTDQEDLLAYRALLAEAAKALPPPDEIAREVCDAFQRSCMREAIAVVAQDRLLHLARRDVEVAALRAALGGLMNLITQRREPTSSDEYIGVRDNALRAYVDTEPGEAFKNLISILSDQMQPDRKRIDAALRALGQTP